jgi:hypothetical protein
MGSPMTEPRKRQWHVAETPGHGCCFSVGIQDAEGNMVADVVYREDGPLLVAAPDLYAALQQMIELVDHAASKDPHSPWCNGVHSEQGQCEGDYIGARIYDEARAALKKADGDAA